MLLLEWSAVSNWNIHGVAAHGSRFCLLGRSGNSLREKSGKLWQEISPF
jgi:hypothetical protein